VYKKNELALLVDANQLTIQSLEEEREQLSAQATFWQQKSGMYQSAWEDAKQKNQELVQKYTELLIRAKGTSKTNDTLKLELVGKDAQIFALQEKLKHLRGF
jgi:predicted RNase H-like nuclease (RuvC/YqgF family)